jgi:hypothetical protein
MEKESKVKPSWCSAVQCREQDAKTLPAQGGMKSKSASKWIDVPIEWDGSRTMAARMRRKHKSGRPNLIQSR